MGVLIGDDSDGANIRLVGTDLSLQDLVRLLHNLFFSRSERPIVVGKCEPSQGQISSLYDLVRYGSMCVCSACFIGAFQALKPGGKCGIWSTAFFILQLGLRRRRQGKIIIKENSTTQKSNASGNPRLRHPTNQEIQGFQAEVVNASPPRFLLWRRSRHLG